MLVAVKHIATLLLVPAWQLVLNMPAQQMTKLLPAL